MNGPHCVISRILAVFLLSTAFSGELLAEVHKCLREFDPSNCNALEEVWAYDAEGRKCIETVYGGCGKPKHLSNRFETEEECMQSCGTLAMERLDTVRAIPMDQATRSALKKVARMERRVSDLLRNGQVADKTTIDNIRSALNTLGQDNERQFSSNLDQLAHETIVPSISGRQTPSIQDPNQGRLMYDQLARPYGLIAPHVGQQPTVGRVRSPSPHAPLYEGQPEEHGLHLFGGNYEELRDYETKSQSPYGRWQMTNPYQAPVSYSGAQPIYGIASSRDEGYPQVQKDLGGIPYRR